MGAFVNYAFILNDMESPGNREMLRSAVGQSCAIPSHAGIARLLGLFKQVLEMNFEDLRIDTVSYIN